MTTLPQTTPIRVPRPMPAGAMALPVGPSPLAVGGGLAGGGNTGLSASDVMRVIRQNIWLIALAVVLGGVGGYAVNRYLMMNYPKYDAAGLVLVQSPSELPEPRKEPAALRPDEISLLQETYIRQLMHERMYPLTLGGLDEAMRALSRKV